MQMVVEFQNNKAIRSPYNIYTYNLHHFTDWFTCKYKRLITQNQFLDHE